MNFMAAFAVILTLFGTVMPLTAADPAALINHDNKPWKMTITRSIVHPTLGSITITPMSYKGDAVTLEKIGQSLELKEDSAYFITYNNDKGNFGHHQNFSLSSKTIKAVEIQSDRKGIDKSNVVLTYLNIGTTDYDNIDSHLLIYLNAQDGLPGGIVINRHVIERVHGESFIRVFPNGK